MPNPRVRTRYGVLSGVISDDVLCFHGVPYAAPPVGARRFAVAAPPDSWPGVRDASRPGLIAPQPRGGLGSYVPGDPVEQGEDCLSLNVFTTGLELEGLRPVIVFVHGGAFLTGTGAGVMYDGHDLARGGAVVVTLNYRLGPLGFLAHPALVRPDDPAYGNWGLSDVIAALRFVADHAESFGGDPKNVTLVGESAGAMIVSDLLAAPSAGGLFTRAVLESGAVLVDQPSTAIEAAEDLARRLGLGSVDREQLLAVPVEDITAATNALCQERGGILSMPFRPVAGEPLLPVHPAAAIAAGAAAGVDVLIGTNRDEFKLFTAASPETAALDEPMLRQLVARCLELPEPESAQTSERFVNRYRSLAESLGRPDSPKELFDAFASDAFFRIPALALADAQCRHARVYLYEFTWRSPFMNGSLGACHGIELPFVFGTYKNPVVALFSGTGEDPARVASLVQGAWLRFASHGDPSGGTTGEWPRYEPGGQSVTIGTVVERAETLPLALLELWDEHRVDTDAEVAVASGT